MAAIAAGGGDDGVNPGDTVTIMTSDLFDVRTATRPATASPWRATIGQCVRVGRVRSRSTR